MPRFFFYKLTVDDGGAPCVAGSWLSLAICKPMIRGSATKDDVIFGFAANSLHPDNRLIYIAVVTEKISGDVYFRDAEYANRGDCIYRWTGKAYLVRDGAKYHGSSEHLVHDLGKAPDFKRAQVLLSDDFRYFGGSLPEHYKKRFPILAKAIDALGRGHRVHHAPALATQLERLKSETWRDYPKNIVGDPSQAPRRGISHRGGGCGTIQKC